MKGSTVLCLGQVIITRDDWGNRNPVIRYYQAELGLNINMEINCLLSAHLTSRIRIINKVAWFSIINAVCNTNTNPK